MTSMIPIPRNTPQVWNIKWKNGFSPSLESTAIISGSWKKILKLPEKLFMKLHVWTIFKVIKDETFYYRIINFISINSSTFSCIEINRNLRKYRNATKQTPLHFKHSYKTTYICYKAPPHPTTLPLKRTQFKIVNKQKENCELSQFSCMSKQLAQNSIRISQNYHVDQRHIEEHATDYCEDPQTGRLNISKHHTDQHSTEGQYRRHHVIHDRLLRFHSRLQQNGKVTLKKERKHIN